MLKDYKTRVTGNYEILRALLEAVNRDADKLIKINRDADEATIAQGRMATGRNPFPVRLDASEETRPVPYRGFGFERVLSDVSGGVWIRYNDSPHELTVPKTAAIKVVKSVVPPRAYLVPAPWTTVISVLEAHGIKMRRTTRPWIGEVETYRCEGVKWQGQSFEGHQGLTVPLPAASGEAPPGGCAPVRETLTFPKGSALVPLDQRAARVAIHFLEPEAPDSAVAWGFFNSVFEQKEYAESYVMEKLAREMMEKDPKLKEEFERKVATDKEFAADPQARLNFFYRRSPWWDSHMGLYPVGRLESTEGIPLAP